MKIKISGSTKQYLKNHLLLIHMIDIYYQTRNENDRFSDKYHIAQLESLSELFRVMFRGNYEDYFYGENTKIIAKFLYKVTEVTKQFHYKRGIKIKEEKLHIQNILDNLFSNYGNFEDEIEFDFSVE